MNITGHHRGVAITVKDIPEGYLRVPDGSGKQIDMRSVGKSFYVRPADDEKFHVIGRGVEMKMDGTLSHRERVSIYVSEEALPDEVRKMLVIGAQIIFDDPAREVNIDTAELDQTLDVVPE